MLALLPGEYPVVHIDFGDVGSGSYDEMMIDYRDCMRTAFAKHAYIEKALGRRAETATAKEQQSLLKRQDKFSDFLTVTAKTKEERAQQYEMLKGGFKFLIGNFYTASVLNHFLATSF